MRRSVLIPLLIAAILAALAAAVLVQTRPRSYLFLEIRKNVHGVAIEGNPPRIMIDFPTYKLDRDGRRLISMVEFDPDDHRLVVGIEESLSGDAGGGISSRLMAVDPPAEVSGILISEVDGSSVVLRCDGSELTLSPGDSWNNTVEYQRSFDGGRMKIVETTVVINHGYVEMARS